MKNFSVQQFTFRPLSNSIGLFPVLEQLHPMGYTGLEMCCFGGFDDLGISAGELRDRLSDIGLKLLGNHFTRAMFNGSHQAAFDYIAEAGGSYAVYNIWRDYNTLEDIGIAADFLNETSAYAKSAGITLCYHNHAAEFAFMDGKLIIDRLLQQLDPAVCLETDVFFARQAGTDPVEYIRNHQIRLPLIHLKQIAENGANVDLPDGVIDMAAVVQAAAPGAEFILEQSSFPGSIMDSLRRNGVYLQTM